MDTAKKTKTTSNTAGAKGIIHSVTQAFRALDYFQKCGAEVGVTELAEALAVHKSTASRLLATMREAGYVKRNDLTGRYSLGIRIVQLARTKLNQLDLRTQARPFLEELARNTNETVHLAIMDEGKLVYIDKVDTTHALAMRSKIGYRIDPHCTALGKAILSQLPQEQVEVLLAGRELPRFTPNTIGEPQMLAEHLAKIHGRGFAIDDEEHEIGVRCAAAAIRDFTGSVVGAISVSGPVARISRQRAEELGLLVKDACLLLSRALGCAD